MRWRKTAIIVTLLLIFAGCSQPEAPTAQLPKVEFTQIDGEEYYILQALQYEQSQNFQGAYDVFLYLHEQTNNPEYLKERINLGFTLNKDISKELESALLYEPDSDNLLRIKAGMLAKQGEYEESKELMLKLIAREKSSQNMLILASIYFHQKEYDKALSYYESIYQMDQDDDTLLAMVDILENYLNRKQEALAYLETVARIRECSKQICHKLLQIYGQSRNVEGLIATYKKLYDKYEEDGYAQKYIELLLFRNDRKKAIEFLKSSKTNQRLLMDLYSSLKEYGEARKLALSEYEKSKDSFLMGLVAIYEYEQNKDNLNKQILTEIGKKFEIALKTHEEALFLNYYGYLLIDHDMDYKKGVSLVKRALKIEPNSPYYIDSLAWGYYKLGECKKAYEVIKPISHLSDEDELMLHVEKINECLKEKN